MERYNSLSSIIGCGTDNDAFSILELNDREQSELDRNFIHNPLHVEKYAKTQRPDNLKLPKQLRRSDGDLSCTTLEIVTPLTDYNEAGVDIGDLDKSSKYQDDDRVKVISTAHTSFAGSYHCVPTLESKDPNMPANSGSYGVSAPYRDRLSTNLQQYSKHHRHPNQLRNFPHNGSPLTSTSGEESLKCWELTENEIGIYYKANKIKTIKPTKSKCQMLCIKL